MTFLVVDTPSPYNAIVGRPCLNLMDAIVSTRHLLMKFPTRFGVGEVHGDQQIARECYKTTIMDNGKEKALPIANVELGGEVEPVASTASGRYDACAFRGRQCRESISSWLTAWRGGERGTNKVPKKQ
ncbi:hypothetical protein CFOL_v3_24428 [Cephalotus follicularis]|uniref:Uncharacterized protein n=1 Tax=Cephalotus follicularis TaxID=3775 RepID=A0A1Q3CL40_CEPFO|nr:hypothetical protein CFOL_v3_24428 [Cephalotus follicularis]